MKSIKLGIPTKVNDGLGYPLAREEDRFKHLLVIGRTGTGKSTYLINLINQEMDNPLIILDPNGFMAKDIAPLVPPERLVYVDKNFPISLNPLTLPYDRSVIADGLIQVLNNSVKEVSPVQVEVSVQMREIVKNALRVFNPSQLSLKYMSDFFRYEEERKKTADLYWLRFDHRDVKGWLDRKEPVDSANRISARLSLFIDDENMKPFIEGENQFSITNIIKEKKVVIFDLSGFDDENTAFIGGLVANQLKNYYIQKTNKESDPVYFYVDECQLFVNIDYSRFLAEARKFKISCNFSIHDFIQVSKELASMLMACHVKVCLGVEDEDAKRISNSFGVPSNEVIGIKKREGIVKIGNDVHKILCYPPPDIPDYIPKQEVRAPELNFLGNGWVHI